VFNEGHMVVKKRIQVTFTHNQWNLIEKFRGELGNKDADIIRNIVISWLSEKSFISDTIKTKINSSRNTREK